MRGGQRAQAPKGSQRPIEAGLLLHPPNKGEGGRHGGWGCTKGQESKARPGRRLGVRRTKAAQLMGLRSPGGTKDPPIWDRGGGPGRAGALGGRDSPVACRTSAGHSAVPRWAIRARACPSWTQFPYVSSTPVQEHRILCTGRDLRAWPVRGT